MENPFSGMTRSRKEKRLIEAGIYQGSLVEVKSVQVTDKTTQEKKTKIVFAFAVPQEDTEISAWFNPSLNDKAQIVKFLKAACGSSFTADIQNNPQKMWEFVQSLVNRQFSLVVSLNDNYNNITSALIIKEKPQAELETFTFSDDNIPF